MLTDKQKSLIRHCLAIRWYYIGEMARKVRAAREVTEQYLDELADAGIAESKFAQYRIKPVSKLNFPHELSCAECREVCLCNYCSAPQLPLDLCTNGRCGQCCRSECKHQEVA